LTDRSNRGSRSEAEEAASLTHDWAIMKTEKGLAIIAAASLSAFACGPLDSRSTRTGPPLTAEKPFAAGGRIEMQLDGGRYDVQPSADNRVRITTDEHIGDAAVTVTVDGTSARVEATNTPNHFNATIDVPKAADVVIHLKAGELTIGEIAGNKSLDSYAGNITIAVGNPDDYASVDATLKAGDIQASAFGGSKSGLMPHFTWSGPGKHTLRADLGAGNLVLRR
jgi:hypothetical protein